MRQSPLSALFLFAFAINAFAADPAPANPARRDRAPNIVIIFTDDQGYADVGFNPHHKPGISTPNIDRIAKSGVIFNQAYITGPMCLPSRAGFLTGRYQQRHGVHWADVHTQPMRFLPAYLKDAGYASTAIGKWHQTVDITGDGNPIENGFDEFYGFNHGGRDYFDLSNVLTNFAPLHRGKEPIVGEKGYLTHRITDEAVDFIERKSNQPFLLYVPYSVPHTPLQAHIVDVENHHQHSIDPARKILLAMIDYLDAGVGRILGALEKAGVYENTIIIFLTDNGGSVLATHADNTPLRGEKLQFLEGGIRVPFAISWPARIKGGRQIDTPVSSLDILPTCLAAAGVTPPDSAKFDGFNLLPLMEQNAQLPERDLFWWWKTGPFAGGGAMRSGDYKILKDPDAAGGNMTLVNLKSDPQENEDLAEKEPERLAELREKFARWCEAVDAEAAAESR